MILFQTSFNLLNKTREISFLDEFYVIITVGLLVALLIVKMMNNISINDALPAIVKEQYNYSLFKNWMVPNAFKILADVNLVFQLAMVLHLFFDFKIVSNTWLSILLLMAIVFGLVLIKRLHFILFKWILSASDKNNYFQYTFNNAARFLGLVLIPLVFLFMNEIALPFKLVLVFMLAIFFLWLLVRYVLMGMRYRLHQNLYFFLYLCALEIVPILVMIKLGSTGFD